MVLFENGWLVLRMGGGGLWGLDGLKTGEGGLRWPSLAVVAALAFVDCCWPALRRPWSSKEQVELCWVSLGVVHWQVSQTLIMTGLRWVSTMLLGVVDLRWPALAQ